jgi:hypothetical protein
MISRQNFVNIILIVIASISIYFNIKSVSSSFEIYEKSFQLDALSKPLEQKASTLNNDNNAMKIRKIQDLYISIYRNEFRKYSQNNEDGVINRLLNYLNMTRNGFSVEFGCGGGQEVNTRYLREMFNWTCFFSCPGSTRTCP